MAAFPQLQWIFSDTQKAFTSTLEYSDDSSRNLPTLYGSTLATRPIRFIKAGAQSTPAVIPAPSTAKGKAKAARSLYHDLESISQPCTTTLRPIRALSTTAVSIPARQRIKVASNKISNKAILEIDLTLSDDPSSSFLSSDNDSDGDDDIVILDQSTSAKLPLRKSAPSPNQTGTVKIETLSFIPPTQYGIGSNTIGWKLLARQGWREGEALGKAEGTFTLDDEGRLTVDRTGIGAREQGIKVPLLAVERGWRTGLGIDENVGKGRGRHPRNVKKPGKRERRRDKEKQLETEMGYSARTAGRKVIAERQERKSMLSYMNR